MPNDSVPQDIDVSIILINYKTPDLVFNAINSVIDKTSGLKYEIIVVDNSNSDNKTLAEEIADSVYISNGKNLGIAAALNKGCQKACSDGFEWCLTMDQDSTWSSDLLEMYLKEVALNHSELTVSFAPAMNLSEKSFSIIGDIRRFFTGKETLPEKQFVENVMTSGNIISLKIWEKTGKFDEKLFIDEVDSDFCFRLISSGYRILKFNNIFSFMAFNFKTIFHSFIFVAIYGSRINIKI